MTESPAYRSLMDRYFRAVRAGKRQSAALVVAEASTALASLSEVTEFMRAVRIRSRVQDPEMLPEGRYFLQAKVGSNFDNRPNAERTEIDRAHLLADIETARAQGEPTSIDWPSSTFHWGVMVRYTIDGVEYRVASSDWQLTETYLSS